MICWSPTSLCGENYIHSQTEQSLNRARSSVTSSGHTDTTRTRRQKQILTLPSRSCLLIWLRWSSLAASCPSSSLDPSFLFRRQHGDRDNKNMVSFCVCVNVCVYCLPSKVLLLTDVSELFELGTLALLCYSGQLLDQLNWVRHRNRNSEFDSESNTVKWVRLVTSAFNTWLSYIPL